MVPLFIAFVHGLGMGYLLVPNDDEVQDGIHERQGVKGDIGEIPGKEGIPDAMDAVVGDKSHHPFDLGGGQDAFGTQAVEHGVTQMIHPARQKGRVAMLIQEEQEDVTVFGEVLDKLFAGGREQVQHGMVRDRHLPDGFQAVEQVLADVFEHIVDIFVMGIEGAAGNPGMHHKVCNRNFMDRGIPGQLQESIFHLVFRSFGLHDFYIS